MIVSVNTYLLLFLRDIHERNLSLEDTNEERS